MRTLNDLFTRVRKLEEKSPVSDAVLVFEDGSTRSLRIADGLQLFLDSMRLEHDRICGRPGESKYIRQLDLMGSAAKIQTQDPLIELAFAQARRLASPIDPADVAGFAEIDNSK
jgi:hypothetical protein